MTKQLLTKMMERLPIKVIRSLFNYWPPFRGAKIKVTHISPDYRVFKTSLKLGLLNRNYVGVHFGGSLFAMTDPFFMLILSKNLGNQYIVWDKAAKIEFKKPGRGTIRAHCEFSEHEIAMVRQEVDQAGKYIFDRTVDLLNEQDEIVATITKTLYVRLKRDVRAT